MDRWELIRFSADDYASDEFGRHPQARQWSDDIQCFLACVESQSVLGTALQCATCQRELGPHVPTVSFDIVLIYPPGRMKSAACGVCDDCVVKGGIVGRLAPRLRKMVPWAAAAEIVEMTMNGMIQ